MSGSLNVSTPEGESGTILSIRGEYLFRYGAEAQKAAAVSLLMPVRAEEYRHQGLHPAQTVRLQLEALKRVLSNHQDFCEQAPHIVSAIKQSAGPFVQSFG
ncbi:hypothetical protein D3C76_430500 [compost metagenome]